MMEMILKSKGKEYVVLYDDEDRELISQYHWCIGNHGYPVGYLAPRCKNKLVCMHRLLLRLTNGSGMVVDHKNHNKLDNRRINIRVCTQGQNNLNSIASKNTSSIYKGVSYAKNCGKWEAYISVDNKKVGLGLYETENGAALAYDAMAISIRGEFANLNFKD